MGEPLAEHIQPNLDEARLARQSAAILERTQHRARPRWPFALVPAAICVAALLFFLFRPHTASTTTGAVAGTILEAPTQEALPITLADGSRVVLAPHGRLRLINILANDIHLELDRGGVDLDVTHVENRPFVIAAAGYEVRVLGTQFSVELRNGAEGDTLEVRVTRGRVRVTRVGEPADVRVLGAGEIWSTALAHAATESQPTPADSFAQTPALAPSSTETSAPHSSSIAPSVIVHAEPDAKELWAQAESARASSRFRDEASALDALRRKHRSDPRAGLSAFELGRLRQDTLHDPAGAAEAFGDAVTLAPTGPFREDAEARRVEALEAAGQTPQCIDARNAFLARYSSSIHRDGVAKRCNGR